MTACERPKHSGALAASPTNHPKSLCFFAPPLRLCVKKYTRKAFTFLREKKHAASKAEEMIAPEVCDATEVERKDKSRQTKKIPQT
jgi:hypothetical protein